MSDILSEQELDRIISAARINGRIAAGVKHGTGDYEQWLTSSDFSRFLAREIHEAIVKAASLTVSIHAEPCGRIETRCPSCGSRSLFIGSGGHLTCGVLTCKSPSVEQTTENMQREIRAGDQIMNNWAKVLDALPCPVHGRCVPHALLEIIQLKHPHRESP